MKTNQTFLFLVVSCCLLSSTCKKDDPPCTRLKLNNNTDKPVYVLISYDYPDTSLNFQSPFANYYRINIGAHSTGDIRDVYNFECADKYFEYYPNNKVSFFVFDAKLVDTTPWITVRQNYQIIKRYDVGKNEVINNNYTLSLP